MMLATEGSKAASLGVLVIRNPWDFEQVFNVIFSIAYYVVCIDYLG